MHAHYSPAHAIAPSISHKASLSCWDMHSLGTLVAPLSTEQPSLWPALFTCAHIPDILVKRRWLLAAMKRLARLPCTRRAAARPSGVVGLAAARSKAARAFMRKKKKSTLIVSLFYRCRLKVWGLWGVCCCCCCCCLPYTPAYWAEVFRQTVVMPGSACDVCLQRELLNVTLERRHLETADCPHTWQPRVFVTRYQKQREMPAA